MAASSISTYMDITRAATTSGAKQSAAPDSATLEQAAKVLAAIHEGNEMALSDLAQKTGLDVTQLLAVLTSLADGGMVELDDQGGVIRVRLTESAKEALTR